MKKRLISYLFVIIFWLIVTTAFAQIQVSQFNAEWNSANGVDWVQDLSDCRTIAYVDISSSPKLCLLYTSPSPRDS